MGHRIVEAVEDENVVLSSGDLSLRLLPHLGGKIGSIRIGDVELLQAPLLPYSGRDRAMSFDESDASGWDECLPSVSSCTMPSGSGAPVRIPDHGDLWRVPWKATDAAETSFRAECFSLPLVFTRELAIRRTQTGWKLELGYKVGNSGDRTAPWSWAAHPLFAVEPGDRIVLPDSIRSLRLEGSAGDRLGVRGQSVAWPIASLASGGETDLRIARSSDSGIGDKLFAGPLKTSENWAALERRSAGYRIQVGFQTAATPYLGLWICYGGWPQRAGAKQMCVALEPSTAPVDSLAELGPWNRALAPGASSSWAMSVSIEPLEV